AGAAYGALVEAVFRPDAVPILPDRSAKPAVGKRLFARWMSWHIVTAVIGGLATMFAVFPVFEQFGDSIARYNPPLAHPDAAGRAQTDAVSLVIRSIGLPGIRGYRSCVCDPCPARGEGIRAPTFSLPLD